MKKILMLGPPKGHNMTLYLQFFEERTDNYQVTFLMSGKISRPFLRFKNSKLVSVKRNPFRYLKTITLDLNNFDLVWIHNWTKWFIILTILMYPKQGLKVNYSVWSEPIPRKALRNMMKGRIYRFIFRKSTFVHCQWYGTFDLVKRAVPDANAVVFPWGLPSSHFASAVPSGYSPEVMEFVSMIPKDRTTFLWPKSISSASGHDLVIAACQELKRRSIKEFKVIFWLGNAVNDELYTRHKNQIRDLDVGDVVEFAEHHFLPFEDVAVIWKLVDAGLQIALHDSMSTSVLEPLFFKKELIITNIVPYRYLEEKFDIHLDLIEADAGKIADKMSEIIRGKRTSAGELEKRSAVVREHFNFDKNTGALIDYIEKFQIPRG